MNCHFIRENLTNILEKELPSGIAEEVDAHLKSCQGCADLVNRFGEIWRLWEEPERIEPSPAFWFHLRRRTREPVEMQHGIASMVVGLLWRFRPAAAVAVLVFGILIGNYLGDLLVWNDPASSPQQSSSQIETMFDYYLGGLDDFPTGSVGEFYVNPGNNT